MSILSKLPACTTTAIQKSCSLVLQWSHQNSFSNSKAGSCSNQRHFVFKEESHSLSHTYTQIHTHIQTLKEPHCFSHLHHRKDSKLWALRGTSSSSMFFQKIFCIQDEYGNSKQAHKSLDRHMSSHSRYLSTQHEALFCSPSPPEAI